jgi:tungstate transport system ATP-binding protein
VTSLVDLRDVSVRFGATVALKACSLQIQPGERLALVGANGSGKSTLLRALHGLLRPAAGQVEHGLQMRQAMVFQRPYMLRASVLHNVALGLWIRGARWPDAKAQALHALARVRMAGLAARNAKTLSGGQQQRLALARAWALKPNVLLLDEPTASLDPTARREVEELMNEFADAGMTLIFSSHNLGQVKRLANRVIYLEQGAVLADMSTHDFFNGPLPAAADLFLKGERA